jgi:tetratricopeptide (TPR) repeat protein
MAEHARIDDLRRRVQKDPAAIAFAQLAEEHRRAGQFAESVEVCRAGLAIHPTYLSARVTLGRALIELGQLDEARTELETVLKSAPENLAALRGVAEICHKQGSLAEALRHYKAALSIARNDPELEQTVSDLSRQVAPQPRPAADNSLSLEDMRHELKSVAATPSTLVMPAPVAAPPAAAAAAAVVAPATIAPPHAEAVIPSAPVDPARARAHETIAVLEQWLDAIHGSRAH